MATRLPDWMIRGKSIRQLIDELKTFENQDLEVRLSLDYGATHHPVSLVGKVDNRYCVLMLCSPDDGTGWNVAGGGTLVPE